MSSMHKLTAPPKSIAVSLTDNPSQDVAAPLRDNWLQILDAMRGLAALYVVCHHARILLLVSLSNARATDIPRISKLIVAASSVFVFGHQAVIFFFVLSGFCIHYRQAQALAAPKQGPPFRVGPYLLRRARRICPPYYFALLLTLGLDWGTRWLNPSLYAGRTANPFVNAFLIQHNTPATLLGNLLFLQSLKVPTFGNDTPLWSLAFEFYLYLLYPVYLGLSRSLGFWKGGGAVLLISALCLTVRLFAPQVSFWFLPVLIYWFSWVAGALAAEAYVGRVRLPVLWSRPSLVGGLAGVLVVAWLGSARLVRSEVSDNFGALACVLLILYVLTARREASAHVRRLWRHVSAPATFLGRFSYTLYLTHVPLLVLLCSIWLLHHKALPTMPWLFLLGVMSAVTLGWIAFWLVERRFLKR